MNVLKTLKLKNFKDAFLYSGKKNKTSIIKTIIFWFFLIQVEIGLENFTPFLKI